MKICWECAGSGNLFAGTGPLHWALCIACKSTGFIMGKVIGPKFIRMHKMPGISKLRRKPK